MQLQNDVGRRCGGCTACCKPFPVPEVGKVDSSLCRHAKVGVGCGIYKERPHACEKYACMWLNGTGNDSYRPDRLGVMLDMQDCTVGERVIGVIHLWEIRKGALEQRIIYNMAEMNKDQGFVVVWHYMIGDTKYDSRYQMRRHLFTEHEVSQIIAQQST